MEDSHKQTLKDWIISKDVQAYLLNRLVVLSFMGWY